MHNMQNVQNKVSLICNIDEGKCQFFGNLGDLTGTQIDEIPTTIDTLHRLINPMDLPERMRTIYDAIQHVKKTKSSTNYVASFRISGSNDDHQRIEETGVVFHDGETGHTHVHSLWTEEEEEVDEILVNELHKVAARTQEEKQKSSEELKKEATFFSKNLSSNSGRRNIHDRIEAWYMQTTNQSLQTGYFFAVGIDRLGMINEAYGSRFADQVIIEVGYRLKDILGEHAFISRIGGDVYGVFLPDQLWQPIRALASNIISSFHERPVVHEDKKLHIGISVGGITFKKNIENPSAIILKSEKALQYAKEQGRGCFIEYTNDITDFKSSAHDLFVAGERFLDALQDNRLCLAYQPVVNYQNNEVSFYECLLRMMDHNGDVIAAGAFIPALEKLGMMRLVDQYSIQQAIQELLFMDQITFSVNITNWTLTDDEWLQNVVEMLTGQEDIANRLIIEITENSVIRDMKKTAAHIDVLRKLGCRIALDDFGAGHTNYIQLNELAIDVVKIDKSFVRGINESNNKRFIQTLSQLAGGMNILTVGEGAEDLEAVRLLTDDGVHQIQGYINGRPNIDREWLQNDFNTRNVKDKPK